MLKKTIPYKKPWWKKWGLPILFVEVGLAGYCYFQYRRLNKSEALRYQFHNNYPKVLNLYYAVGERIGGLDTRQTDLERWKTYQPKKRSENTD